MKKYFIIIVLSCIAKFSDGQDTLNIKCSDAEVMDFLSENGIPVTHNNHIKLLTSAQEKFDDLFPQILNAEHHIHLEYFNFRNDSISTLLFGLLANKVKDGVQVRVIFDAFGNFSNNKPLKNKHLDSIKNYGIEIVKFDPLCFPFVNHVFHRNHRKIVVIDGKTAYIGGINIADYYIEGLPKIGEWRDMHARIEGDAVRYIQENFLAIWNKTTGQTVEGTEYFPEQSPMQSKTISIVDRTPRKTPKILRKTFVESINSANYKIQLVNPYFLPTRGIKKALKNALKRGVKVEIMISAKSDIKFTPDGVFHAAHKLMKKGADIYIYYGGFHHSKVMTVDDLFCTVGSANMDSRSMRFDYETNAFIFDKDITLELNDIFENDKLNSILMTPEIWKERSGWRRFIGWCSHALTPFL